MVLTEIWHTTLIPLTTNSAVSPGHLHCDAVEMNTTYKASKQSYHHTTPSEHVVSRMLLSSRCFRRVKNSSCVMLFWQRSLEKLLSFIFREPLAHIN